MVLSTLRVTALSAIALPSLLLNAAGLVYVLSPAAPRGLADRHGDPLHPSNMRKSVQHRQ